MQPRTLLSTATILLALSLPAAAQALGSEFTYQGLLMMGGQPVNGPTDFQFSLYDDPSLGGPIGSVSCKSNADGAYSFIHEGKM